MLSVILGLLGSSGFGTVFGGLMGWLNRKSDLAYKKLEYDDKAKQREHELKMHEFAAQLAKDEIEGKIKVADMEGSFKAMAKSYEFAVPDKGSKMATFSAFIRPFISLSYFLVTSIFCTAVLYYAFKIAGVYFDQEQWYALTMFVLNWIFFMASTSIGWWYAMRAGKAPTVK